PRVDAITMAAVTLHAHRRIGPDHADIDAVVEEHPQHLEQIVGGLWRVCLRADHVLYVRSFEARHRLVAVLVAEALKDVAAHRLGAGLEPAEFRAAVVGNDQRVDRPGDGPTGGTDVANLRLLAFERRRVLAHEIFRPWDAGQVVREPALAETNAPLAALAV